MTLTRRSFVGAGAMGVAALALRPRRSVAEAVTPSTPTGLWGAARTDAGLVALWSASGRASIVRLSDRGPVEVTATLGEPDLAVLAGIAAGGSPLVLGAHAETVVVERSVPTDHLVPAVRETLLAEVDGPLSLDGIEIVVVGPLEAAARSLDGAAVSFGITLPPGGIISAVLDSRWVCVQHPPTDEGDHCSSLTVFDGDRPVLTLDDLGAAGPASLAGPTATPVLSVTDATDHLRIWQLGRTTVELTGFASGDGIAVHVADGRPVALRSSPDGATLLAHGAAGWEAVVDVADTEGAGRVLAVSGAQAEFLLELPGRVVSVDGRGQVRR